jgi:HAD superfamily hydrolase (TIGR01509 family)
MIRAIVFDFGGTLVLTQDALLEAFTYSLRANDVTPPPKERLIAHIGRSNFNTFKEAVPSDCPNRKTVVEKCFKTFQKIFPNQFLGYFKEVEGTEATLLKLARTGYRLGIATCLERREVMPIITLFKWHTLFDIIVTLEDYVNLRPAPDCVLAAASKLKTRSDECAYVGDTVDDVEAGKAAHAKTVAVLTGAQPKKMLETAKPDLLIQSISLLINPTLQKQLQFW